MPAPRGNKNALGNKGGGRKSAYQELSNAQFLWEFFHTPINRAELAKRIATGECTPKEIWMLKIVSGNERLISDMFKKLFPDSVNLTANLNQKQMSEIEGNVRNLLDLAGKYSRKEERIAGKVREQLTSTTAIAKEALAGKPKVKVKIKKT